MMKAAVVAVVVMVMAAIVQEANCTNHTVGGTSGWNLGVDYTNWANGETFLVGDTLVFNYGSSHSVEQVSQSDYTSCSTGNAINTYTGGSNSVPLSTAGIVYFICPTSGHCQSGMKLMVTVGASSTTPSSSPPTTPSTSPSTPASSPPPPPPPPSSGSVGSRDNSKVLLIGASVLAAAVGGFLC